MPAPAPSLMLLKISPSVVPFFQSFGDVRSVASATTSTRAFPSVPWQSVQDTMKVVRPRLIDFLVNGIGLLSFLASARLNGTLSSLDCCDAGLSVGLHATRDIEFEARSALPVNIKMVTARLI